MIAAFAVVLATRTSMPAVDYARAACGELSVLLGDERTNEHDVAETLARAAARADRAAMQDEAFAALDADLDRLHAAVVEPDDLTEREETAANYSMASLADACAASAALDGQLAELRSLTIQELRRNHRRR